MGTKAWDVVVLDATGNLGEQGHPLRRALVRQGLRVKLDIVPALTPARIPAAMFADARDATYLVVLMRKEDDPRRIVIVGSIEPGFLPAHPDEAEPDTGDLPDDLNNYAARIARLVRPAGG